MAYEFPWEAFMQAQAAKNRNKQQMMETFGQTLAGLGQNIGQGLQRRGQQKAQQQFGQLLSNSQQPVQGPPNMVTQPPPQIPGMSPVQGPSTATMVPPNQPPVDFGKLYSTAARAFPGQAGEIMPGIMKMFSSQQKPSKPTVSLWRNSDTNEVSTTPKTGSGWFEESGLSPSQRQSALSSASTVKQREVWAQQAKERTHAYITQNVYNDLNSLNKSSGNVLGQAATIQFRSQRGDHLLDTPGLAQDKLVYGLVQSDLAAIAQGGSPTIAAQAEATLPTFKEDVNKILRRLTANPKDINQPEVKKQLRKIFQVMNAASGSIIEQNTAGLRAIYQNQPWMKENKNAFEEAVKYLGQGITPFDPKNLGPMPNMPTDNAIPGYGETTPMEQ